MNSVKRLSKSQYCRGKSCLKHAWLYNFKKELADEPSEFQTILFRQGTEVGDLARDYFPDGELIHEDYRNSEGALQHTKEVLKKAPVIIYEGAFLFEDILIRVDILKVRKDGSVDLIEVKSSNSAQKKHYDDVAIQKYVLEKLGCTVRTSQLMHLNKHYLRDGELDIQELFTLENVDEVIDEASQAIPNRLKMIRTALQDSKEPDEAIGSRCNNPYPCPFRGYCWSEIDGASIHRLTGLRDKKRAELVDKEFLKISDIPVSFKLSETQKIQRVAVTEGSPVINEREITNHLKELRYPLHFFDFESVSSAIPPYDNTHPYLHLPFQYSLHLQMKKDQELEHIEFLHDEDTDPRRALAEKLCEDIADKGSVIVYHAPYERGRLEDLSRQFPDLSDKLNDIISRLWDLETPFRKRWYCDGGFSGSSSIKKVLPIMAPDMSYLDLDIQNGGVASSRYEQMIRKDPKSEKARAALLEYCKRDTIAMVKILDKLSKVCSVTLKATG